MFEAQIADLKERQIFYPQGDEAKAELHRDRQSERWRKLLEACRSTLGDDSISAKPKRSLMWLEKAIVENEKTLFRFVNLGDQSVVTGEFPLLNDESLNSRSEEATLYAVKLLGVIFGECASEMYRLAHPRNSFSLEKSTEHYDLLNEVRNGLVGHYANIYLAEKALLMSGPSLEINRTLDEIKAVAFQQTQRSKEQQLAISNLSEVTALTSNAEQDRKRFWDEFVSETTLKNDKFLIEAEIDKNAALAAFSETEAFKAATDTWKNKKTAHTWTFGLGLAALALLIFGGTLLLFSQRLDIFGSLSLLRNDSGASKGEMPHYVLLMILIPAFAIGWVLRIFGKFVTGALVLASDAQQRLALLETYLRLLRNNQLDPTDKTIVLAALFRPLPGQDDGDVQPPTLLDLLKKDK